MNKLDLSRCLMFRTDPSVDSAPPLYKTIQIYFDSNPS